MRKICSFCKTVISPGASPDEPVSHGVCKSCFDKILAEHGFNTRKCLDLLDAPVFLVDADANVLAANFLARSFVKKPFEHVRAGLCGNVLDCINAYLPHGCGKTAFCPECTIRNSVTETYTTGIPVTGRPALLNRKEQGKEEEIRVIVSTRKDGEVVLLRLEPATAAL
jgi:hypothetical protein